MTNALTVTFSEYENYDITLDCEIVNLMATTGAGTYSAIVIADSARKLRELRALFKERAIEAIREGLEPCELELN